MASLQPTTATLQSKYTQIPRNLSTQKPILNLSLSTPTFSSSLKLKSPTTTTRRSKNGSSLGARMSSTAASSYAATLADIAKSNDTLDATTSDVEKIDEIFSDKQVFDFFANPTIAVETKREFVDDIATSSSLQPHTRDFLKILIDSRRIDIVKEIVKEFEFVYNTLTDTELAIVSSVVKLEAQHLAQIAKQVQKLTGAKNVRIKTVIDPSLVAGFTVRYGNSGSKLIDMSVKKQLEEIATQLDFGDIKLAV